jgi:tRNA(Ile)-lysidine synthase
VSVEEAGRNVRYEAFAEAAGRAAAKRGLDPSMVCVALAHNSGDLSETVLMRIIRGTGPDGLASISAERGGEGGYRIVRPLIDVPREDIEEYCSSEGLSPRRDGTNEKTDYLRNSVRIELLPMLREKYNPSVDDALARLSRAAAESRDYFDSLVGGIIEKDCGFSDDGEEGAYAEFPVDTMRGLHPAVRHRLVVAVFGRIGLTQDIGAVHLAAADGLLEGGRTGKGVDFPGGYRFGISYDKAVFTPPREEGAGDSGDAGDAGSAGRGYEDRAFAASVADLGKPEGKRILFRDSLMPIEAEVIEYDGVIASGGPSLVLDYDALSSAAAILQLRANAPGDRICLPGVDGSKKLQDIFVDEKIPREKRRGLLVVATEDEVLWIPGLRRTRLYAPGAGTERALVLTPVS